MPEIIATDDAHDAFDIVKTICTQVGPGIPGSSQERERAAIIKNDQDIHNDQVERKPGYQQQKDRKAKFCEELHFYIYALQESMVQVSFWSETQPCYPGAWISFYI